jgi:hypothetical protein
MRSILSITVLLLLLGVAHADNVDTLVKQLGDKSEKIRLASAVNLAKAGDERGILPLAKAVTSDSDKNVRAAAAVGLGKLITANPATKYKSLAVKNLANAAANDASDFVKQQANAALKLAQGGGSSTSSSSSSSSSSSGASPGKGGIYVNVGPMSSKTTSTNNPKLRAMMVKTTEKTLSKVASNMAQTWPGGAPTKSALASKGVSGFYVDGTLNTLDVKVSGGGATISCKVSMLLADFPDKSVFGFLSGGASVTASASQSDQDLASEDCVSAVMENLIANKIVPTIKSKVP